MVTAVSGWLKAVRRIDVRQICPELALLLDGFEKKIGLARQKKPPTTEVEVAAFMDASVPEGVGGVGRTVRQLEVDAMGGNRVRSMVAVSAKARNIGAAAV